MNTISTMMKKGMVGTMVLGMLMMVSSAGFAYTPAPAKVVTTKTTTTTTKANGKVVTTTTTTTTKQAARPVIHHKAKSNQRHHAHHNKQIPHRPVVTKRVVTQPAPKHKVVVVKTTKPAPRATRGKLVNKGVARR